MGKQALHLLHYHQWANNQVIQHCLGISEEIIHREVEDVFPSIRQTLLHLYDVDCTWFARMKQEPVLDDYTGELYTLVDIKAAFQALYDDMDTYLRKHEDDEIAAYPNSKDERFENSIVEIMHHVSNHGTYHRGNISSMLRKLGHTGASTDYIFYLRQN